MTVSRLPIPALILILFLGSFVPATQAANAVSPSAPTSARCSAPNTAVMEYAEAIGLAGGEVVEALRLFPKGADLHNHLSGAVMPEDYLALSVSEGDCFGPDAGHPEMKTLAAAPSSGCSSPLRPVVSADAGDRNKIVGSLSMYDFPYTDIQSGHDQFFATFGRFGAVSGAPGNRGPMLARLLRQALGDNVSYLEIMTSFQSQAVAPLASLLRQKYPNPSDYIEGNFDAMLALLQDAGLQQAVAVAQDEVSGYLGSANAILRCGSQDREPACGVSYNFLASVKRDAALPDKKTPDLAKIFTQTALSFLLASQDPRVVGVNLLSGEDGPVSLAAFGNEMDFFRHFHKRFPRVNIALHAGEFTPCFVGPNNPALKDHLVGSLKAGAKRIGHGVAFHSLNLNDRKEVAQAFNGSGALIEIMFTSNAQILGVAGKDHPFPDYRTEGVPIAFATDDEGVSHADFTTEWIYGYQAYGLRLKELKLLARQSLQHSFLPGASLWSDLPAEKMVAECADSQPGCVLPSEQCRSFLARSRKATLQWEYEARLAAYLQDQGMRYARILDGNRR